jgi:hypothetical protein
VRADDGVAVHIHRVDLDVAQRVDELDVLRDVRKRRSLRDVLEAVEQLRPRRPRRPVVDRDQRRRGEEVRRERPVRRELGQHLLRLPHLLARARQAQDLGHALRQPVGLDLHSG